MISVGNDYINHFAKKNKDNTHYICNYLIHCFEYTFAHYILCFHAYF